jgi:hypothetical protein
MTLWRSWHLRNDIIHAKGKATVEQSVNFLISYVPTINYNPDSVVEAEGVRNVVNRADYKGKKGYVELRTDYQRQK